MHNSAYGIWKLNSRRDMASADRRSSYTALLNALQQLGLVDEEFNILPPPNQRAPADPGRPH